MATYDERVISKGKYSGKMYTLGQIPGDMVIHNRKSWWIIHMILKMRNKASYEHLSDACFGHRSGDVGQPHSYSFVSYCIRSGWLKEVA